MLAFSTAAFAQEGETDNGDKESGDPDSCVPFPSCALDLTMSDSDTLEEQSFWAEFWDELTEEMKEKLQYVPPKTEE